MADAGKALKNAEAEMDMTPMIDVVFLLIIFFMLVSEISNLNLEDIQLPRAPQTSTDEKADESMVILNVRADGTLRAGGRTIWPIEGADPDDNYAKIDEIEKWLRIELELKSEVGKTDRAAIGTKIIEDLKVLVRADAMTRYRHIGAFIEACQKVKVYKISFASEKEKYSEPR